MDYLKQYTGITHTDLLIIFFVCVYVYLKRRALFPRFSNTTVAIHFGDLIGVLLIFIGVGMIMLAPLYHDETYYVQIVSTAGGLISAGFIALKLKSGPIDSNGTTTSTTSTTVSTKSPSTAASVSSTPQPPLT